MGVEDDHEQVGSFDQWGRERVAGLLDGNVVVLGVGAWEGSGGIAGTLNGVVGVGVDILDVIKAGPFAALLELDGGGPLEREGVALHITVSDCADDAVAYFLATHRVEVLRGQNTGRQQGKHSQILHRISQIYIYKLKVNPNT